MQRLPSLPSRTHWSSWIALTLAACTPAVAPSTSPPNAPPPPTAAREVQRPAPASASPAPEGTTGYDKPPQAILDVMRAPSPPSAHVSPTGDKMLLVSMVEYPPMSRVAEPFLRLAGVRV